MIRDHVQINRMMETVVPIDMRIVLLRSHCISFAWFNPNDNDICTVINRHISIEGNGQDDDDDNGDYLGYKSKLIVNKNQFTLNSIFNYSSTDIYANIFQGKLPKRIYYKFDRTHN